MIIKEMIKIKNETEFMRAVLKEKIKIFIKNNTYVCGAKATYQECLYASGYNDCLKDLKELLEKEL